MTKEFLNDAVLFVHENAHERDKQYLKIKFGCLRRWHEIPSGLVVHKFSFWGDINTFGNIHLINDLINHDHYKILFKEHGHLSQPPDVRISYALMWWSIWILSY